MSDPALGPVLGAVLVGGASRRMGRDKAVLPFRGRLLAEHVAAVLAEVLAEVVLVTRDADDPRFVEFPLVADRRPGEGPLAGLEAALLHASGRPVLLAACDLPGLIPELVRLVLDRGAAAGGDTEGRAWVPVFEQRYQPLAALYSSACLPAVRARLDRGQRAMHGLLDDLRVTPIAVTEDLPFFRPDLLLNVNRPGDLARFE